MGNTKYSTDTQNILYIDMMDHMGQILESEFDNEVTRLKVKFPHSNWKKDHTPLLQDNECDENGFALPPAKLKEGYCWLLKSNVDEHLN